MSDLMDWEGLALVQPVVMVTMVTVLPAAMPGLMGVSMVGGWEVRGGRSG